MNNSKNITESLISSQWGFAFITQSLIAVTGFVLNAHLLIILLLRKNSSFLLYLRVLIAGNVLFIAARFPLYIIREFSRSWWMGVPACSLHIYSVWVFPSFLKHVEVLITINRIWALTFPLSYKNQHTKKVAGALCGGMFLYVHLVGMPGFFQDLLMYRLPISKGCAFNGDAQNTWHTVMQFLIYDLPLVFVVAAYPYLLYKHMKRRKRIQEGQTMASMATTHEPVSMARSRKKPSSRPFLLQTLLTGSLFLCSTPVLTFWTIGLFTSMDVWGTFYKTAVFLSSLQLVLDPILLALSFKLFSCRTA